jgi:uncharacterized SAM-binding protein YcdF (DUF218 family)
MMFFLLRTLLKNLVLPPAGPLLLALLGILLLKRRPILGRSLALAGIAALWLLATPVASDVLVRLAEREPPLDFTRIADAQAVVILGGGGQRMYAPEYGGPAADPILLERLSYGAFLAHKSGLPVLISGFHGEAEAMHDTLLRNFAIEPRWMDNQAHDTFENAANSARLLSADGVRRILLVTSGTHMWRSAQEFTAAGFQVIAAPAGMLGRRAGGVALYLPSAEALMRTYAAGYELLGDPVRVLLQATHLRRHPATPTAAAAPAAP